MIDILDNSKSTEVPPGILSSAPNYAHSLSILVAAHKDYWMPLDTVYTPIQVGAKGKSDINSHWLRDDSGENISVKNPHFCELTALYWAWKQLDTDYVGLVHYRRYFASGFFSPHSNNNRIANGDQISQFLQKTDIILPKKRHYWIETNYSQYVHAHHEIDLIKTKEIIGEFCPEYLPAWEVCMARTSGHRFNMLIMQREVLDKYCSWLFPVLFELEKNLDISDYNALDSRVFGLVSERLLDIWLLTNHKTYQELPVINLESQHWPSKMVNFLKRKFSFEAD